MIGSSESNRFLESRVVMMVYRILGSGKKGRTGRYFPL